MERIIALLVLAVWSLVGCNGKESEPGNDTSQFDSFTLRPDNWLVDQDTGEVTNLADREYVRIALFENFDPYSDEDWSDAVEVELPKLAFYELRDRLGALDGAPGSARLDYVDRGEHGTMQRLAVPRGMGENPWRSDLGTAKDVLGTARQAQVEGDPYKRDATHQQSPLLADFGAISNQDYCARHGLSCIQPDDSKHSWCFGGLFETGGGAGLSPESGSHQATMPPGVELGMQQVEWDLQFTNYQFVNANAPNHNLPNQPQFGCPTWCGGWLAIPGTQAQSGCRNVDHIPHGTYTNAESVAAPRAVDVLMTVVSNNTLNGFGRTSAAASAFIFARPSARATFNSGVYFGNVNYISANFSINFSLDRMNTFMVNQGISSTSTRKKVWKSVVAHEWGHTLGLRHNGGSCSPLACSVMEPGPTWVGRMLPLQVTFGYGYDEFERDSLHRIQDRVWGTFPPCGSSGPDGVCGTTKFLPFSNREK